MRLPSPQIPAADFKELCVCVCVCVIIFYLWNFVLILFSDYLMMQTKFEIVLNMVTGEELSCAYQANCVQ